MKFKKNDLVLIDFSSFGSIFMVDWSSGDPSQMPVQYHKVLTCRKTATGIEYKLEGYSGWWKEDHLRLKPEEAKSHPSREVAPDPDTLQGEEAKCDTGDSGASGDSLYFQELYLKALKKTYGKVPFESETVEVGSLLDFTKAILETAKEV